MNYIFYASTTVNLKACVTKFFCHIRLLSPLPLSAWEIPECNTQNPVSFGCPFQSFENSLSHCQVGFTSLKHSPRCYMFRVLSVPVGFRLYPVCLHFWDADFLWQVQPCPWISDPGSPSSWMEHTCYFLLCKPPPPPCLFTLSIPISDILPLVPSTIFHTSRYFHGNQSKEDKKAAC